MGLGDTRPNVCTRMVSMLWPLILRDLQNAKVKLLTNKSTVHVRAGIDFCFSLQLSNCLV